MKEILLWFSLVLCGSGLIRASDSFVVNCINTVITGKYGSSVVLPCWLNPEINVESLEIRWYRPDQFKNPLLFYQNGKIITDLDEMYTNRSSLTQRVPTSAGLKQGDVSLRVDNLGLLDSGIYHCYVSGDKEYDSGSVELNITALGSQPLLSLEHHHNSVNLSCSSCGWFPRPSLFWKATNDKGDTLGDPHSIIYTKQKNGLFCLSSWIILLLSSRHSITCSVKISEDEKWNTRVDLGAQVSGVAVWKVLFVVMLLCFLALIGIGFFLYRKYKGYTMVNYGEPDPTLTDLKKAAVKITMDTENCRKQYLVFNKNCDTVRDNPDTSNKYNGPNFPYELCIRGKEIFYSGQIYWEVELKSKNVKAKKSWLVGVAKASFTMSGNKSHFTPSNGFWFLYLDPKKGLHVNTKPKHPLQVKAVPERLGVLLDIDKQKLLFYNATHSFLLVTLTIDCKKEEGLVPLFNPGIGDTSPLRIINPSVKDNNEAGGSGATQANNQHQNVSTQ